MIKYNLNTINDWNFGDDNIIKVYRNNAVCYYKVTSGDTPTPVQEPCFAVVDDISQYSDTEFEDVFNLVDNKWYKLNNLNQYEEYGIYGSGRTITYYDGKLTVDDGYEYMYSGGSWVNVGEVSGSTATLPNVPFTVNYNAKSYDSNTKTLLKTSGQLADVNAVITAGTPTVSDGYLTIASGTRATISGYQTYFNRDNNNPNITIISKQNTNLSNCHIFANRDTNYNWMYRPTNAKLNFHGSSQVAGTNTTTQPVIESVRVDSNRLLTFNNYTDNTTKTSSNFNYGSTNSGKFAIFAGYATNSGEWFIGDFYWIYMSQNTLTDEQVQQVIDYNEGGGSQPIYPLEYVVREDPPNNLTFSSMAEAEAYECPWVGMSATIDGDRYVFSGDSQSGYEWVYTPKILPTGYTAVEYIQNASTAYINTNYYPNQDTRILAEMQVVSFNSFGRLLGAGNHNTANTISCDYVASGSTFEVSWGGYTGWTQYSVTSNYEKHTYDWNKNSFYIDGTLLDTKTFKSFTCSYKLGIFNVLESGDVPTSNTGRYFYGKLYSFKIYDNDTLVRDFVPCKRDSDSKYGLYDVVNDVFYISPNNTNFSGGNPI